MPIICWGNLAKSADDTLRIEQSISDYVEGHNEDPNAHQSYGSSLYMHRFDSILDHVYQSVQKFSLYPGLGALRLTLTTEVFDDAPGAHEVWTDIDLTGLVPEGTKAVFLYFEFYNEDGKVTLSVRKKGETGTGQGFYAETPTELIGHLTALVGLDDDYKCEYWFEQVGAGSWSADFVRARIMGYM